MRLNRPWLFTVSLILAIALMIVAFGLEGFWWIIPSLTLVALFSWIMARKGWHKLPATLLLMYLGAAIGGILLGSPPAILILGVTTALISWELATPGQQDTIQPSEPHRRLCETSKIKWLATSACLGSMIAETGLLIHLSIPFWGVMLAGMLVLFSLYRLIQLWLTDAD